MNYKVDVQHCTVGFESWSYRSTHMALKWNKKRIWINPKINHTLNGHTMDHIVMDSEIAVYAGGNHSIFQSYVINQSKVLFGDQV